MKTVAFGAGLLIFLAAASAVAQPVRVDLDGRLELAGAVERLSAPVSTSTPDGLAGSAYVRDLTRRLPKPSDPELLAPRPGWSAADRARLMLSLSPVPALEPLGPFDDSDAARAGGPEALGRWLAALRAYALAAGFDSAFNASRYLLDPDAASLRRRLAAAAPLSAFEAYTGMTASGPTTLLLSPFQASGPAPGYDEDLPDGSVALTVVVGPAPSTSAASGLEFWSNDIPVSLWNELAQTRLQPLAELYSGRIAQSAGLAARPEWNCPRDWRRCVEDQVARAVTLRLVARRFGAAAAEARREGFEGGARSPLLEALLKKLALYEKARKRRGERLADYYPELLSALPLDDPRASPAPPALPAVTSLSPSRRRRLAAFLKEIAPRTRNRRLRALAARSAAWAAETAPPSASDGALPPRVSTSASSADELRRRGIEEFGAGRAQAALDDFRAALSSAPRDAQTLASEAAVLDSLGRGDEALSAYTSALTAARSASDAPSIQLAADVLSSRAVLLEKSGKAAQASADLEDALRTAPPDWARRKEAQLLLKRLRSRARRRRRP